VKLSEFNTGRRTHRTQCNQASSKSHRTRCSIDSFTVSQIQLPFTNVWLLAAALTAWQSVGSDGHRLMEWKALSVGHREGRWQSTTPLWSRFPGRILQSIAQTVRLLNYEWRGARDTAPISNTSYPPSLAPLPTLCMLVLCFFLTCCQTYCTSSIICSFVSSLPLRLIVLTLSSVHSYHLFHALTRPSHLQILGGPKMARAALRRRAKDGNLR